MWSYLHSTFGGSPAVTKLQACQYCLAAAHAEQVVVYQCNFVICATNFSSSGGKLTPSFAVQRQKEFELAEFKMLHSEEGGERDQGGDRCRSSCPFFDQLPCVCQVLLDCCMVQGLGGLGLWKGERATRVGFQRHGDTCHI